MKIASSWLSPQKREVSSRGIEASELLPLLLVLIVALLARLALLDRIPTNVMPDEADNMVDVYHILAGTGPGLIGFDWTQLPALNVYIMAGFVRLFGLSVVGMRMAAVVTSTLALIPFYLLARRAVSPLPASLATLLLSTGLWYLNFSRTAWSNIHVVLFGLWTAWLLLQAINRQKLYLYVLAGVGMALTLYGYYSGRAMVVALILFLPFGILLNRDRWRAVLSGYLLMTVVAVLLFLPQGVQLLANWNYSNTRVDSVSIFHQAQPYLGQSDPVKLVTLQAERTVRGFLLLDGQLFHTPRYTPFGQAPVDYVTGFLFWAGLLLGLVALRETLLWYLLLLVPLFLTQVFSIGTPDTGRAIVVVPFIYLFVAAAFESVQGALRNRSTSIALVLLALVLSGYNLWWYFDWARSPETAAARQPAVEYSEFSRWQELQMERASRGERGFTVTEWLQMRRQPGG